MEKRKYIKCQCNAELVELTKFEGEEEVYLTVYQYSSQRFSLLERIKILFGGKTVVADLVFSKEDFKELCEFAAE
jgi:hypothetical protein